MERILAIQMKRIGDLILTAPALSRLRRARPGAEITLLTMGAAGQLATAIPSIDRHLNYRYRHPNLAIWSSLLWDRYDTVLDFNGSDRTAFLTGLSRAGRRAGYGKRARGFWRELAYTDICGAKLRDFHTIDHLAALLDAADIPALPGTEPTLTIPEPVQVKIDAMLRDRGLAGGFVVVHPGTARAEKYWLPERWAEVIRECATSARGLPCVITGGNDAHERGHLGDILRCLKHGKAGGGAPTLLAGKLSLLETAAVIRRARLVLGVDTAAMHLAAAFEVPEVVLFGPTNPYHWRPRQRHCRVILAGHPGHMTDADYRQREEERPMEAITSAQVIEAMAGLPRSLT